MINVNKYIDRITIERLDELCGIHGLMYQHEFKEMFVKRFGMHIYESDIPDDMDAEKFGYELCGEIQDWYDRTLHRFISMSKRT